MLAAATASCGGGGERAPPSLLVGYGGRFDCVSLTCRNPKAFQVSRYVVEHRQPPGPFVAVDEFPGAREFWDNVCCVPPPAEELTDHEFRLRITYQDGTTALTEAVPFHVGIIPPEVRGPGDHPSPEADGFHLRIGVGSRVAEQLLLERQVNLPGADPGSWVELSASLGDTSFVDSDLSPYLDGAQYVYRASLRAGAEWSDYGVALLTDVADPLPPRAVAATPIEGGIRVSYENTSTWANKIAIERIGVNEFDPILVYFGDAPQVGETGSYDDLNVSTGTYRYLVHSAHYDPPLESFWSSAVAVWAASTPPSEWVLVPRVLEVTPGAFAASLPSGDLAMGWSAFWRPAQAGYYSEYLVSGSDGFELPSNARLPAPGIVVARDGRPHAVFEVLPPYAAPPSDPSIFVHAWHDGAGWRAEEIARRSFSTLDSFDVGLDGTLRATFGPGLDGYPELATLVDGSWRIEAVGVDPVTQLQGIRTVVTADSAGTVHLLAYHYWGNVYHVSKDENGWRVEPVAYTVSDDLLGVTVVPPVIATEAQVVAGIGVHGVSQDSVVLVQRAASGWSTPEVYSVPRTSVFRAARSGDAGRFILVAMGFGESTAILHDQAGSSIWHWFDAGWGPTAVGFGPDGKAWILDWLNFETGGGMGPTPVELGSLVPAVHFDEP